MPHCPHCGSPIPASAANCPSCGASQQRAAPRYAPPPQPMGPPAQRMQYATPASYQRDEYGMMHRPGVSGLGVAAIVLGGVAMLFAWIPFCGAIVAWPIALIGLILGIIAWAVAHNTRTAGLGVPITGTVLCLAALVIPLLMWSYVVRQANRAQQARMTAVAPPPTTPAPAPAAGTTPTGVTHPAALTVGDFKVRLTGGESHGDRVILRMDVRNTASAPVDFDLYAGRATLKDELNNQYALRTDVERAAVTTTVQPNSSIAYTFTFDPLQPPAQRLVLSIPANGQSHALTIPRRILKTAE